MRKLLPLVALIAGCSDYDLVSGDDNNGNGDGDTDPGLDSGQTTTDACESSTAPARDVVINDACDVELQEGSFTPVIEWTIPGHQGFGPPVAGQLDDDNADGVIDANDIPDVCWVEYSYSGGGITCVNGTDGSIKWNSTAGQGYWDGQSGLALGDVDGDGIPEIAATDGPGLMFLLDNRGNEIWHVAPDNGMVYYNAYPGIADLDGDGFAEVISGRNIYSYDGRLLGRGAFGSGAVMNGGGGFSEGAVPALVDLDGDGELEVVTGNAAYRIDGSTKYSNGLADGNPAVADFDGDGEPEIVVASGPRVYTLESDLTPTGWAYNFNSNYVGPIAIDDLDGDGIPEFVAAGANTLIAFHWDGSQLWSRPVQDYSGAAGAIMFDFEMDGYPEVVYADETKVHVFNGLDGTVKLESSDHASATTFENPIVADVDNDGEVEIVMLHAGYQNGISCYGDANHSWPGGRQVWNQHAYTITNVNDDLSIPAGQEPNWDEYNNYRSGDAGLPPSSWRDVGVEVVDSCVDECPARLQMVVRVLNQGTEDLPAGLHVVVRAGQQGEAVAEGVVDDGIPSGRSSEGIELSVNVADLGGRQPWVEADRNAGLYGYVTECDEDNNALRVEDDCP
jgi:hypothetical protein